MAEGTPRMTALEIDRVYVIHVRRGAEDRAASIERQLAQHGIEFEYVLDGDRDQLTPALIERWFRGAMAVPSPGTSCSFKHLIACERILRDGRRDALVLEDDILLSHGFVAEVNRSLAELRSRGDMHSDIAFISLENTGLETVTPPAAGRTLVRADHGRAAGAYWLSRDAAAKLLRRADTEKLDVPFDHFQNRLFRDGEVELWWRHPAIAEQGSHNGMFYSMLEQDRGGPMRRVRWLARKTYQQRIRPLLNRLLPKQ